MRNSDDLIQAEGKFSNKPRGKVGENTIQGNVDDIFNIITTGGTKRESGAIGMPNGSIKISIHRRMEIQLTLDFQGKEKIIK